MISVLITGIEPIVVGEQRMSGVVRTERVRQLTTETVAHVTSFNEQKWSDPARLAFTDNERSHLEDVRTLYEEDRRLAIIVSAIVFVLLMIQKTRHGVVDLIRSSRQMLGAFIAVLCASIILAGVFFHPVFDWIHVLLFPHGNWSFPPGSQLIEIFPERLWMEWGITAWMVAVGILLGVRIGTLKIQN